jgi:hypothetical protein
MLKIYWILHRTETWLVWRVEFENYIQLAIKAREKRIQNFPFYIVLIKKQLNMQAVLGFDMNFRFKTLLLGYTLVW